MGPHGSVRWCESGSYRVADAGPIQDAGEERVLAMQERLLELVHTGDADSRMMPRALGGQITIWGIGVLGHLSCRPYPRPSKKARKRSGPDIKWATRPFAGACARACPLSCLSARPYRGVVCDHSICRVSVISPWPARLPAWRNHTDYANSSILKRCGQGALC